MAEWLATDFECWSNDNTMFNSKTTTMETSGQRY